MYDLVGLVLEREPGDSARALARPVGGCSAASAGGGLLL